MKNYNIEIIFNFRGTEAEAKAAAKAVEDAVGRVNGDLECIHAMDENDEELEL